MNMEKFPSSQNNSPQEFFHDPSEYLQEEDERLVGTLNSALERGDIARLESTQERLASRIAIIRDYESGAVPTYASYANVLESLIEKTAAIDDPETQRLRKLAEGRVRELRTCVRRYVERVAKYQHVRMKMLRVDESSLFEELVKIDADRRKTHNALIETLQTTGKVIAQLREHAREEADTDAKVQAYPSGRGDADGEKIFDADFIADRKLVRDWAIAAWTIEQIRKAKEKAA